MSTKYVSKTKQSGTCLTQKMLSDRKRVVQLKNVVRHKPSEQDLTRGQIKRSVTRNGEQEDVRSPIYQKRVILI